MKKLSIGSGTKHYPGFETIDIEPHNKPVYLGDFRVMKFKDIEEIRADHILEHFDRSESLKVLRLWHGWLKPGGKIRIETPDMERMCQIFITQPSRLWAPRELIDIAIYGSQEANWAYHKNSWWKEKYEKVLPQIGFKIIQTKQIHANVRYNGVKYRLPYIWIEAIKNV